MRQVVLDTETTGLEYKFGHRVIEIGCVELVNRRLTGHHFHHYINPEREVEQGALNVHGITNEFLLDKPLFGEVAADFLDFVKGAELIIHNAPFDMGFLNHELKLFDKSIGPLTHYCSVFDTLTFARKKHPGQRNSLDALSKRYSIDHFNRELHGALLDAEILALVYLAMTGGQSTLFSQSMDKKATSHAKNNAPKTTAKRTESTPLKIIPPTDEELKAHDEYLKFLNDKSDGQCVWLK